MRNVLALAVAVAVCLALMLALTPRAEAQIAVTSAAGTSEYEFEFCPGVASTTYGGAPSGNSRAFYTQNRSSATCYLRFDALAVTTNGASGYKLAPGDSLSFDIGDGFAPSIRAACTAATTTGACLYTSWWK